MRLLVKRDRAAGHEETELFINWDNVHPDDIKLRASYYIQHRVEDELKGNETKLPESVTVLAMQYIHREVREVKPLNIPKSWKEPPKSKARKELEALMGMLSKEEIAVLVGE